MLPLTIWMNMPSFHQDDLLTSLANSGEVELRVVFARELTAERMRLGWNAGTRQYRHRTLTNPYAIFEAGRIARRERDRLHIVNGIWAESAFAAALVALRMAGSRFVIHSEAPDAAQRRSLFKRWLLSTFGRWIIRSASGVLAISHFAADFYHELGFRDNTLYPFGYFRALADGAELVSETANAAQTEIIFVGQLIRRKGVDVLLEALRPLFAEYADLRLTLVGDGVDRAALKAQAAACGFQDRIAFAGAMPAANVQARIAAADLLALPSRWDGWGMVVNEALSLSVPVAVSTQCGASDLIRHDVNGYVFRSEDTQALRDCLRCFLRQRRDERLAMRRAARVTGESLAADIAARYLIDCLKHMTGIINDKPVAPWLAPALFEATGR
jgi:glycosyltransferase involved in cell wall biosynthesis